MIDYVIVGAGSAGCVLANRLVDKGYRVTVLEAGGSDARTEVRIPAAFTKLFHGECDWGYRTVPQPSLFHRALYWPRARMLGGCSSMNAQMWYPGFPADYDGWASAGATGWDWNTLKPYLSRIEHGRNGDGGTGLHIEPVRDPNPSTRAFLNACERSGVPRLGASATRTGGYSLTPTTQRLGRRFSAADGYLRPAQKNTRLDVITNALVRRVLFEGTRAVGVEYRDGDGQLRKLRVAREVILSSGAVNSPQLLLLSGVGDPEALRRSGIDVVLSLPGVGKNLQDHLMTAVIAECPKPVTLVAAETLTSLLRFLVQKKGHLTSNVGEAAVFIRTRPELAEPDIELIFAPVPFQDHGLVKPAGHGVTLGPVLLQPKSTGEITLASNRPEDAPLIDPRYLSDADGEDVRTLAAGVEASKELLRHLSLREYVGKPIEPASFAQTPAELARFVAEQCETLYHPVGTCKMGTDALAVVDPELRVRGLTGLRVADASVMPRIIRGHTHAPAMLIAERGADLIAASPPQ